MARGNAKMILTKERQIKIHADARRAVDLEQGVGINRRYNVSVDRKKKDNKEKCRRSNKASGSDE